MSAGPRPLERFGGGRGGSPAIPEGGWGPGRPGGRPRGGIRDPGRVGGPQKGSEGDAEPEA